MSGLVLLGDRDALHREGAAALLDAWLQTAAPATPDAWTVALRAARRALAQGHAPEAVAADLAAALHPLLAQLHRLLQQQAETNLTLERLRNEATHYKYVYETLLSSADAQQLAALQAQVRALQQQLAAAQDASQRCALALEAERQTVAARDAAIVELQHLIAKQHLEFDGLFGELEDLE